MHVRLDGGGAATSGFLSNDTCRGLVEATLHAAVATFAKDAQGRFVYVNRCWARSVLDFAFGQRSATQYLGSVLMLSGTFADEFERLLDAERQALTAGVPVVLTPHESWNAGNQFGGILFPLITDEGPILVGLITLAVRTPQVFEEETRQEGNTEDVAGHETETSMLSVPPSAHQGCVADDMERDQSGVERRLANHRHPLPSLEVGVACSDGQAATWPEAAASANVGIDAIDQEIVAAVARGDTTSSAANRARCSNKTVERGLALLRRPFDVPNTTALVARCYSVGLLLPGEWPPRLAHAVTAHQASRQICGAVRSERPQSQVEADSRRTH